MSPSPIISWSLFNSPNSIQEGRLVQSLHFSLLPQQLEEFIDDSVLQIFTLLISGRLVDEGLQLLEDYLFRNFHYRLFFSFINSSSTSEIKSTKLFCPAHSPLSLLLRVQQNVSQRDSEHLLMDGGLFTLLLWLSWRVLSAILCY